MKIFRYIIVAALFSFLPILSHAQDESCVDCTVSGVLERLPAENMEELDSLMARLSTVGGDAVHALAAMLAPPEEGENAVYEYALNGLVAYVSAPGREEKAAEVKDALFASIDECEGDPNRAFLLSLTRLLAGPEDFDAIAAYLDDEYLGPFAVSVLGTVPDIDEEILGLVRESGPSSALAYLVAVKGISGAEEYILKWTSSPDSRVTENVYRALGACGTGKSLMKLSAAAYADNYALGKSNASEAYFMLLRRLVGSGDRKAFEQAQQLLRSKIMVAKANAFDILFHSGRLSGRSLVLAALKDGDREYRCDALFQADDIADEDLYSSIAAMVPDLGDEAVTDIVTWLGERHALSQASLVAGYTSSKDAQLAIAAIRAAGRLECGESLDALTAALCGPYAEEAASALASYSGDITEAVTAGIDGSAQTQVLAIELAGGRRVEAAAGRVAELMSSDDPQVRSAAYLAYSVLGGEAAVSTLFDAAKDGSEEAFHALLTVEADLREELLELGGLNDEWRDGAVSRVCDLIGKYAPEGERTPWYLRALELRPSARVTSGVLDAVGGSGEPEGIALALQYTDDHDTAAAAAYAVKNIVAGNRALLDDEAVVAALLRAREVLAEFSSVDADAGYAVNEIDGLIEK